MIVKKRTRMKLTALFLTCICFVTSVGSCYYGPGIQAVSAQEVQKEDAQDSTLTVDEDAQNLSAGGTGISEDSTELELADESAVTDYLFFDKDGKQIGEPQDSEPTDGSPEGCVGYVKRTTAGTNVTVEPYAMTGYEFAMLDLLSKETDQTNEDKYTPLSRNYVKDKTSNKEITTTDISYTFTLDADADYENGTSYKVMPDLNVYFDKTEGKLNEILTEMECDSGEISQTSQTSDTDKLAIQGWLSGKISAGAGEGSNTWSGSDVKSKNANIIFDAGENKEFEISEVVAYGRFGWRERLRFSVKLSDDEVSYNDVLAQTTNNDRNLTFTSRECSTLTEAKTGRYLKLSAQANPTDISYMAIYGSIVSTCNEFKTVKKLLEEYKAIYDNNSSGYNEDKWNEFKSKCDEAQNKVTAHEEEDGCNETSHTNLTQAGEALKTAYQNLIDSKSDITYQFFKDGEYEKTENTLVESWESAYDGYVKVAVSEDRKSAVLTPVAASEHEFSLMTLEAYENGNLVRSFSPISNYYRYKENPTNNDTELVKDNNYEVKLTLGAAGDGGAKSRTFTTLPTIKAYFDSTDKMINDAIYNTKESGSTDRKLEAILKGHIHAGGDKWSDMFETTEYTDKNNKTGIDFQNGDYVIFKANAGEQFSLDSIVIYGRTQWANSRYAGLVIETSNDGNDWTKLHETTNYPSQRQYETPREIYNNPVCARYIRLKSTKNNLNISMIKFYGAIDDDKIDYYSLKQACDEAKVKLDAGQIKDGEWNYTEESWNAFTTAYNAASDLLKKWDNTDQDNPSPEETVKATKALTDAMQNLAEDLPTIINNTSGQLNHPAVGNSATDLARLRKHVTNDVEPWASYFKEFSKGEYASLDYDIKNDANPDSDELTPKKGYADYHTNLFNGDMMEDSKAAYYQSVMYYMTGDVRYREKAMRIMRLWSKLNPEEAFYANDAHIHHATPVYYFNCAAELLRYTSTTRDDLKWTEEDTNNYITNFLEPPLDSEKGWFIDNKKWFNQHQTVLMARLSSMIFMDNKAGYEETVEWVTVNSNAKAAGGDVAYRNGAIENAYPLLTVKGEKTDDGYNTTSTEPYVAIAEMVRDQPHAGENMTNIMYCARMLNAQGTKLDPIKGTVSTASDAKDIYSFLDDRLIKGVNYWCKYNLGYEDMIFYDKKEGVLSDYSRGRIWNIIDYYMHYKYAKGYTDTNEDFKYVAEEFDYICKTFGNYRDESWMYIPDEAQGKADNATEAKTNPVDAKKYEFENQAHWDSDSTSKITTTDSSLNVTASESGTTFAMLHLYNAKKKIELKYKSSKPTVLDISRYKNSETVMSIILPGTDGNYKSVVFDPTTEGKYIDNKIFYYHIRSSEDAVVEFDHMLLDTKLESALYENGTQESGIQKRQVYVYPGMQLSSSNAVTGEGYTYKVQGNVPERLEVSNNGNVTWSVPGNLSEGTKYECYLVAEKNNVLSALELNLEVTTDYQAIIASISEAYNEKEAYESETKEAFEKAKTAADAITNDSSDDAKNTAIQDLEKAVAGLRLLNPKLSDGTLDYTDRVDIFYGNKDIGKTGEELERRLALLIDDDFDTYSSDVWDKHERSIIYDFGEKFRFRADSFQFAPRTALIDRTANIILFGSNDAKSWVPLTDATTTSDTYQTIEVFSNQKDKLYRYIMTKQPSVASGHPMSYSEFRMIGERVELEKMISNISIKSDDEITGEYQANGNVYKPVAYSASTGKIITLTFDSENGLSDLTVEIEGQSANITHDNSDGKYHYTASITLESVSDKPHDAAFSIQYTKKDGKPSEPLQVTSDETCVFVSNKSNIIDIDNVMDKATSTDQADNIFDNNMGTFPNFSGDAHKQILIDFGNNRIHLERIEILPRYDFNTRLMKFYVEASVDGQKWRNITKTFWGNTKSWASLSVFAYDQSVSYHYLRLRGSSWHGNIAEARLYGECGENLTENLKYYTVSASPREEGTGTCKVYFSGQSIDNAEDTLTGIKGGDVVMLKAFPAKGYKFKRWVQEREFCGVKYDYTFTKDSSGAIETTLHYSQGEYQGEQWYNEVIDNMDIIAIFEKTGQESPSPSPSPSTEPVASKEPAVSEEPVASEEPAVSKEPVASEGPTASEGPVASEEPVTSEEPITSTEPAASTTPGSNSGSSGSGIWNQGGTSTSGGSSNSSSGTNTTPGGSSGNQSSSGTNTTPGNSSGNQPSSGTDKVSDSDIKEPVSPSPADGLPENKVVTANNENPDGTFTDENGELLKNIIVAAPDGNKYITDSEGKKITSCFVDTTDGTTYYVKATGVVAEGEIIKSDNKKYFAKDSGPIAKNEFCTTSKGSTVYATSDGTLASGKVITVDGKKYFAKVNCVIAKNGLFKTPSGNKVYAKKSGVLAVKKIVKANGNKYYAKKSGVIATKKIVKTNGNKYYAKKSGVIATKKIVKANGNKYYAKKSGAFATDKWVKVGKKMYYCNSSGKITKTKKVK